MNVLIAEDSLAYRKIAQRALENAGLRLGTITCVNDGQQALEVLRSGQEFHLLVLDIYMPGMDGLELLAAIRADEALAGMPAVMMTGRPTRSAMLRAVELGANGCLQKPFTAAQMGRLIRDATGSGAGS